MSTALRDLIPNPTAAELELVARYAMLPEDARRERAFSGFAMNGLPHRRMERWKWTDFKQALPSVEAVKSSVASDPLTGIDAVRFVFDGTDVRIPDLPKGVRIIEKAEPLAIDGAEDMPLMAMTAALAGTAKFSMLLIEVTETVEPPLHFVFAAPRNELGLARIKMVIREGASISVVESHLGGAGLNSALVEFDVKSGANLQRSIFQNAASDQAQAITGTAILGAGSEMSQTMLAYGAKISRLETLIIHEGKEASVTLNSAYLCGPGKHVDVTTEVRHTDTDCETSQLTKGAVRDGGKGVFQGKFVVPRIVGQRTNADMQHNALLLENGAEVFAKPELEIYADDVECAHGNTCGQMDETALFYMRQRGIPEAVARAMLTEAFVAEALETADERVQDILLETARDWLNG